MTYRRAHANFSNRTWEEFTADVNQARNEHLMEGIVAGCALVAYADGWVTDDESRRMQRQLRGCEPIKAFGMDDVIATFEATTRRFSSDHAAGETAAMAAVARLRETPRYAKLLVEACCAIAAADGGFDGEERAAVVRICSALALDPSEFGVADAP